MNRRPPPPWVRCLTHECLNDCGASASGKPNACRQETHLAWISGALTLPPHSVPHTAGQPAQLPVGVIQEGLQLLAGERAGFRAALIVVEMRDRVPLVADRHRKGAERILAGNRPAIAAVADVLAEQPKIRLITADRGRSQML